VGTGAVEAQPDKLGRVVIPRYLRSYAKRNGEVVVVGLADRIEVWAKEEWGRERLDAEESSAALAEQLP
jgi:MraZ protein